MEELKPSYLRRLHIRNEYVRETLAEFFGTFLLIVIGCGSVAQYVLGSQSQHNFLAVNICWFVAVAMGVYVAAGVSGGHINPAVSLAMCILQRLEWKKLPLYMLGQYLGAFFGAAVVFVTYIDAINHFDGGVRQVYGENATAGIFATYPAGDFVTWPNLLIDQIVGTAILTVCVMALVDCRNASPSKGLLPIAVGLVVLAIGTSYGYNIGYAINPARDFSPRLFTAISGWGVDTFRIPIAGHTSEYFYFFWIPILGPHFGAIVGCFLYLLFIEVHHTKEDNLTTEIPLDEKSEIKIVDLNE